MQYKYKKKTDEDDGGEVKVFERYLKTKGLKLTRARRELLDVVFEIHEHFTADDLYEHCRDRKMRVSKATLYRTLSLLLDCNLLVSHDFDEGAKYYEHIYGHRHHDHFFCLECKKIIEFRSERIEELQDDAAAEFGFKPMRHSLAIFGLCRECQAEGATRD